MSPGPLAPNGGPQFKFTEAISFSVNCETQDEIDYFWEKLSTDGGPTGRCGWLENKFGLSWQVSPVVLGDMLADPDKAKAARVMKAMMEWTRSTLPPWKRPQREMTNERSSERVQQRCAHHPLAGPLVFRSAFAISKTGHPFVRIGSRVRSSKPVPASCGGVICR
jgi:hypothetical protein